MSVKLKKCYHLPTRSVLGKRMNPKTLIFLKLYILHIGPYSKSTSQRTCFIKGNTKERDPEGRYHDAESDTQKHTNNQPTM